MLINDYYRYMSCPFTGIHLLLVVVVVVWLRYEKHRNLRTGCRFHCIPKYRGKEKAKTKRTLGAAGARVVSDGSSHEKSTFVATSRAAFVVVSSSFVLVLTPDRARHQTTK